MVPEIARALVAVGLIVAAAAVSPSRAGADCVLRVAWEPYAPYTFRDESGEISGIDIEVIKAVAEGIGCELTYRELPWARILLEVENGAVDISSSTSLTPERARWAYFSRPYRRTEMALFVRRGESSSHRLDSLTDIMDSDFRLGVIDGYFLGEDFARLKEDPAFAAHVDPAADYATNLHKLAHGRIDGFLVDDVAVLMNEARALDMLDTIERHPLSIPGDELHFMFSKRSVAPEVFTAFDRELARLQAEGRFDHLLEDREPRQAPEDTSS